jgi:hypothetical protein
MALELIVDSNGLWSLSHSGLENISHIIESEVFAHNHLSIPTLLIIVIFQGMFIPFRNQSGKG